MRSFRNMALVVSASLMAPTLLGVAVVLGPSSPALAMGGPRPIISNFTASPSILTTAGPVTLTATVSDDLACSLSSNHPIPGLPAGNLCTTIPSAAVSVSLYFPENSGRHATRYTIKLQAVDDFIGSRNIYKTAKVKVLIAPGAGGGARPSA
jgi:hypothetical protein